MHEAEGQRGVGAGIDGEIPVGALRGASAVGIDDDELGAAAARLCDEGPQVNIVAVNVCAPGDDVAGMRELLGLGAELDAENGFEALFAGGGTDGALELGGAETMEEAAVHGSAIERAERAAVGVGQNGFGADVVGDAAEAVSDFVEGFVPGDAGEGVGRAIGREVFAGRGKPGRVA